MELHRFLTKSIKLHRCVLLIIKPTHSDKEECDHTKEEPPMIAILHKLIEVKPFFDLLLVSNEIKHPSGLWVERVIHVIHEKKNRRE
jgi:hypothetical protein